MLNGIIDDDHDLAEALVKINNLKLSELPFDEIGEAINGNTTSLLKWIEKLK